MFELVKRKGRTKRTRKQQHVHIFISKTSPTAILISILCKMSVPSNLQLGPNPYMPGDRALMLMLILVIAKKCLDFSSS